MWNYRVIYDPDDFEYPYYIGEVYYDEEGEPTFYSGPMEVSGESFNEVVEEFEKMAAALDKEVLEAW